MEAAKGNEKTSLPSNLPSNPLSGNKKAPRKELFEPKLWLPL
jgi:hypothetical protein